MMIRQLVVVSGVFCCTIFAGLQAQVNRVKKTANGISIAIDGKASAPQTVNLEVINDNIIHVTSSPFDSVSARKSLMIVDTLQRQGKGIVRQSDTEVTLQTATLTATVSLSTGEVSFTDKAGRPLLREAKRDCNAFVPAVYSGDRFHQLKQAFISDPGEAYYGLGQHQSGVMNYKGHQVVLSQYNTEVAIPFVISSKNYGILWDNYSITKVGDIRDPLPLSALKLYSASGAPGWLTATYSSLKGKVPSITKPESVIDYSYLKDQKFFPDSFKLQNGLVKWEGFVESPYPGLHTFLLKYAGYARIWLDDSLVTDRWRQAWNPGSVEIPFNFSEGKKYKIAIEWRPDGTESYLALKVQTPVPAAQKNQFAFQSEAGDQIDYYFVAGKDMDEVISGYRTLTGRAPIMPRWALGFWQSRERYKTQDEILNTVKAFRDRKIPLDNIVLDWSYWSEDQWGSQEFDHKRFPDPAGMVSQLHDTYNTHLMISVWPKFYKGIESYKQFASNGWLYSRNVEEGRRDWIGKGYLSTFYDPFNDKARNGFWKLMNTKLYSKGVDAWWLDATEPDIHSNLDVDTRKTMFSPSIGSGTRYFNAFPLQNAKAVYEGQRATNPDSRVFILTRSAFGGQQRYSAATWSGDISSRWHDMKDQVAAGINFSMSGLPYWTMDIGGFSVEKRFEKAKGADLDEWRELNTRWFQWGAFTPLFRVHGQYPFREVFNIAPENHPAYQSMLFYNKLRYRLMPYIYSLAGKTFHENYTIMRGLPMDFNADTAVRSIADQFMFGPSILVNPVTAYKAKSRSVYLPAGANWYDAYTGKYLAGGKTITADAPYDRMPLYIRAGSIIPAGPEIQYTAEKPADPLTLYVYTGKDGSFSLYEDENLNYNYEKGVYSQIDFSYKEATNTLIIGKRTGSFPGMLQNRTFNIVRISPSTPAPLALTDTKVGRVIKYTGEELTIKI